jgi:mono/diheme cytochrome c family protein
MLIRSAVALALFMLGPSVGNAQELSSIERGEALVRQMCAACHAVGTTDESPHLNAPPFRQLHRVVDFGGFIERLRDGLFVAHRDMPEFRFTRRDARAVTAYLSSIQQER